MEKKTTFAGHYFAKKTATESHRLLVEVYGENDLAKTECFEWFKRFRSGDFDTDDKERPGQPESPFDSEEMKASIDKLNKSLQEFRKQHNKQFPFA